MSKNNAKTKYFLVPVVTTLSFAAVFTIGFSSWVIGEKEGASDKIIVNAGDVSSYGIDIKNIKSTSSLNFDSLYLDDTGRVYSDLTSEKVASFNLTGELYGYTNTNLIGIRPILQIDSSYRSKYQTLLDYGYINEPAFSDLNKGEIVTSSLAEAMWWSKELSTDDDSRQFSLNYSFSWGSFFANMNPSEFFDSNKSNAYKKGKEYTTKEIKEILSNISLISGAKWTLYLDVVTTDNTYTLNFNGGTGSSFSNYETSTTQTLTGLTLHSKVSPSRPSRSSYKFSGWKNNSKTYGASGESFYLNEVSPTKKTVDFEATRTKTTATITLSYSGAANSSSSLGYMILTTSGNTTKTYNYSSSSATELVNIGDIFVISRKVALSGVTVNGMEAVGINRYKVTSTSCTVTIETAKTYTITFKYDGNGVSLVGNILKFQVGTDNIITYNGSSFDSSSINVVEKTKLKLANIRGISSFSINGTEGSEFTLASNTTITIRPMKAIIMTLKFTADTNVSGGDTTYNISVANDTGFNGAIASNVNVGRTSDTNGKKYYVFSGETYTISGDNIQYVKDSSGNVLTGNKGTVGSSDFTITITGKNKSCVIEGTLITLADGSKKPVEDIQLGELLKVFNHETGRIDVAPLIFNTHKDAPAEIYEVMNLIFDDGSKLRLVSDHGVFDKTLNKYSIIRSDNVNEFIGHEFYKNTTMDVRSGTAITLLRCEKTIECLRVFCPVTAVHLNVFAEDILTIMTFNGGACGLYNMFDLDENMKYDPIKKQADIEKYGLFSYADFMKYVTYEAFLVSPGPYMKVSVGKGLVTWNEIVEGLMFLTGNNLVK